MVDLTWTELNTRPPHPGAIPSVCLHTSELFASTPQKRPSTSQRNIDFARRQNLLARTMSHAEELMPFLSAGEDAAAAHLPPPVPVPSPSPSPRSDHDPEWPPEGVTGRLYASHFLSTCNSRVFEFGSVLYLAAIFPGTLLPMSVYAMARGASAILLSSFVGEYIDTGDRLQVVRLSIGVCVVVHFELRADWCSSSTCRCCCIVRHLLYSRIRPDSIKH